jgi:hypothetical protein
MNYHKRQQSGRIAEVYVELMLTNNGWLCGNFNLSTENSKSWDLFAKKGTKTIVIRVKGAQNKDVTWNANNGINSAFSGYNETDSSDMTAIVLNIGKGLANYETYFIETKKIVNYLKENNIKTNEFEGILHLHFSNSTRVVKRPWQYGLNEMFEKHKNNWELDS